MSKGFIAVILVAFSAAAVAGCRQDMHNQPKMIPGRHSAVFADGRSERSQVPGTISRGDYFDDAYLTTGLENGSEGTEMPFPVTFAVLKRGQERFNIYCAPCHSRVGNGKGAIVARGFPKAGNLQRERLREAPVGHYFYVMTHGYGAMPDYAAQMTPVDRWAVAAYIRALQLSQSAPRKDVPNGVHIAYMRDLLASAHLRGASLDGWDAFGDESSRSSGFPVTTHIAYAALESASPEAAGAASTAAVEDAASSAPSDANHASQGDAARGKQLYLKNCAACHQPSRAGMPLVFPSLLGIVEKDGEAKVRKVIKDGVPDAQPPMPAHSGLTQSEMDDLIAFLKTK